MGLLSFIGTIFKPAAELVDNLTTSEEERLQAKAVILDLKAGLIEKSLDYEREIFAAKANIVNSEAQSEHWLTSSWRPITMLTMLGPHRAGLFRLSPCTGRHARRDVVRHQARPGRLCRRTERGKGSENDKVDWQG